MDEQLPEPLENFVELWNPEVELGGRVKRVPQKRFSREEQSKSIVEVFHQIGGQDRFAHWANEHYDRFITKLFSKTLAQQSAVNVSNNQFNIQYQPAIPPGPLDAEFIDVKAIDPAA